MDKERAAARTSEHLADLRREGSLKAAEFERLANLLEEEADEVEAQYRRMERASRHSGARSGRLGTCYSSWAGCWRTWWIWRNPRMTSYVDETGL